MLRAVAVVTLILVGVAGCTDDPGLPVEAALPEDPCDLLTRNDVAKATNSRVVDTSRNASIDKAVAFGGNADAVPVDRRRICTFDTTSQYGAITLWVPRGDDAEVSNFAERRGRNAANGWHYRKLEDVQGRELWAVDSGSGVTVVAGRRTGWFVVGVQIAAPERPPPRMLRELALSAVEQLDARGDK